MSSLLLLFVIAESLIRATLADATKRRAARRAIHETLATLKARAIGTPDKPGAAWDAVAEAYKRAAREARDAQNPRRRDAAAALGARHRKSAERLFGRLASRLDAAIAHVALDIDRSLGASGIREGEIPEVKGFTDRAGKRWDLSTYARMCARTTAAEARSEATVNTLIDRGIDLVQVSRHEHPNDVCDRFEGRVYSISGGHPRYTKLRERPPFHPNCRHVLREYRRGGAPIKPVGVSGEGKVQVDTDSLAAFVKGGRLYLQETESVVRVDPLGRVFVTLDEIEDF